MTPDDTRQAPTLTTPILTDRQFEILNWVRMGMHSRAIAGKLFITEDTVKTHLRQTYRQLGAVGRANAVDQAWRLELFHNVKPGSHVRLCGVTVQCGCREVADYQGLHTVACLVARACPCRQTQLDQAEA